MHPDRGHPIGLFLPVGCHLSQVMIRDTDERARAYIAGPAPNRWGVAPDGRDINTIMEPIPPAYNGEGAPHGREEVTSN